MTYYVPVDSPNPIQDAIKGLCALPIQEDEKGKYYFEESVKSKSSVLQCYEDETIRWDATNTGRITPANTLEIAFDC